MYDNLKHLTVLLLEDNEQFAQNTIKLLNFYFKEVIHCVSIKSAKKLFDEVEIDLIISDLKVTDGIAIEFIKYIREEDKQTPIIILSAHKDEKFLFEAIPLQIMKYLVKPISFEDFESVIKDCSKYFNDYVKVIELGKNIEYDYQRKSIIMDNQEYTLTKKEVYFIELLIKNKHKVTTKDDIQRGVWKDETMSDAALKNMLLRLRKKVDKDIFVTVQNIGYKLA